jgi:hypothetical protein
MLLEHEDFTKELSQVPADSVAAFLLYFACCDALAHIAWAAVHGCTPQNGLDQDLKLSDVRNALQKLDPTLNNDVIKRVFEGGKHLPFASASAKFLRNKIMHEVRREAIYEFRLRGRQLLADMQAIISALWARAAAAPGSM